MRINHNIQALNAYRNLSQTMAATSKSLEKLSSGLRINKAADDAAGLAISEKMRSQIRGLDMAERNTLDAISLIQTGEGALNEVHSILQRMRELSVQAANGTLETQDREAIQSEIDQLTKEIDRIADTTQFNQKILFSGSGAEAAFAKVNAGQVEYRSEGVWSGLVIVEPTEPAKMTLEFTESFGALDKSAVNGTTFTINGLTYQIYADEEQPSPENGNIVIDLVTGPENWSDNDGDEIQNINLLMNKFIEAIGKNDGETFNTDKFTVVDAENDGEFISGKLTLVTRNPMSPEDAGAIKIEKDTENVNLLDPDDLSPFAGNTLKASDTASYSSTFNIEFTNMPKDSDQLKIDNLTIFFKDLEPGEEAPGYVFEEITDSPFNDTTHYEGTITINIRDKNISDILSEISNEINNIKNNNDENNVLTALTAHSIHGNVLSLSTDRTAKGESFDDDGSNGLEVALFVSDFDSNRTEALELTFQIGANSSESLTVELNAMDAGSLGIGRDSDGNPVGPGNNAEHGVDVMSVEAAQRAIELIDNAITIVSAERSKLGAIQNRLEHTTNNLQTASENLTAAESRIRDLDMAQEMTTFTRNNILNQAGQAMLAQANQLPQGILQLLQ